MAGAVMARRKAEPVCPDQAGHTPSPDGYVDWHEWATRMAVAHRQVRCPGCGRFEVWVKRAGSEPDPEQRERFLVSALVSIRDGECVDLAAARRMAAQALRAIS